MTATRIFILSFCRLGDSVVMLPALHALKRRFPQSIVECVSQQEPTAIGAKEVLEGRGLVDAFHAFPLGGNPLARLVGRWRLFRRLRRRHADYGILLMPPAAPLEPAFLAKLHHWLLQMGCSQVIAPEELIESVRKEDGQLAPLPKAADTLLSLLKPLGLEPPKPDSGDGSLPPHSDDRWRRQAAEICKGFPTGRLPVAVAIGSNMPSKRWPVANYRRTLEALPQLHPVYVGSAAEAQDIHDLAAQVPGSILTGRPLPLVAEVLRNCRAYLGNDTGLMHLAAACGVPCVAIFSARGLPGLWEPYGIGHRILTRHPACEGCQATVCPIEGHPCLTQIQPEEAVQALKEVIGY